MARMTTTPSAAPTVCNWCKKPMPNSPAGSMHGDCYHALTRELRAQAAADRAYLGQDDDRDDEDDQE